MLKNKAFDTLIHKTGLINSIENVFSTITIAEMISTENKQIIYP